MSTSLTDNAKRAARAWKKNRGSRENVNHKKVVRDITNLDPGSRWAWIALSKYVIEIFVTLRFLQPINALLYTINKISNFRKTAKTNEIAICPPNISKVEKDPAPKFCGP